MFWGRQPKFWGAVCAAVSRAAHPDVQQPWIRCPGVWKNLSQSCCLEPLEPPHRRECRMPGGQHPLKGLPLTFGLHKQRLADVSSRRRREHSGDHRAAGDRLTCMHQWCACLTEQCLTPWLSTGPPSSSAMKHIRMSLEQMKSKDMACLLTGWHGSMLCCCWQWMNGFQSAPGQALRAEALPGTQAEAS